MEPAVHQSSRRAVRAEALFVSALQRYDQPSAGQVQQAVAAAIRAFGPRGCAERVAQEFGDHPETAVARMRWARGLAGTAFSARKAHSLNGPVCRWFGGSADQGIAELAAEVKHAAAAARAVQQPGMVQRSEVAADRAGCDVEQVGQFGGGRGLVEHGQQP
jgi:hypothetical protein